MRSVTVRSAQSYDGIERDEGNAQIRRMGRDAVLTDPQHGMNPVVTVERRAAASRLALVARGRRVSEVIASRPLKQVAAGGRHVSDLR